MFEKLDMTRFRDQAVGIATGGKSQEREISLKTGQAFEEALQSKGYDVTVYDVATDLEKVLVDRPAAMVLGIHGGLGESGALQGFLESLEIPYTGSGVLASAVAMDKSRARLLCAAAGVPVADGHFRSSNNLGDPQTAADRIGEDYGFPVVAKLNDSGSSFGVYLCQDRAELVEALEQLQEDVEETSSTGVLIEQFIDGPEYTVGFFDDRSMGVIEIMPDEKFYDFEAKYQSDQTGYDVITDEDICRPLIEWSKKAIDALGCRGVARVDFKGRPDAPDGVAMLEVNTIPGMTATSLVPKLAADSGVAFADFVEAMLVTARLDEG